MREKYESLSVTVLRDLCKARGIKGTSKYKKEQLVEAMLKQDEIDAAEASKKESQNNAKNNSAQADGSGAQKASARKSQGNTKKKSVKSEKNDYAKASNNEPNENTIKKSDNSDDINSAKASNNELHDEAGKKAENTESRDHAGSKKGQHAKNKKAAPAAQAQSTSSAAEKTEQHTEVEEHKEEKAVPKYNDARPCEGILEVLPEGYGFIRSDNYLPGDNDIYVSPSQIRRFNLKTGDIIKGQSRNNNPSDKFGALLFIEKMNDMNPEEARRRPNFEDLTPVFPNKRILLERDGGSIAMRIVDIVSPIGKGQRGMIVSQPKAGKTTLLKQIAMSVKNSHPEMRLIILLIDERPEEVTDMKETVEGDNCEVIYSTFDETPEHHKRVSEMVIERAKRLVEQGMDVMILLDSITRLARAYNLTVTPSGRTLSGGLDPAALHMPKKFFGAARNMREGGSLTILATALVETGSKLDDVVFEEFKGTGNMELVLDRRLSEKRVFPAIDLARSSTRRDDLLLSKPEQEAADIMRRALNGMKGPEAAETIIQMMTHTRSNADFVREILRRHVL